MSQKTQTPNVKTFGVLLCVCICFLFSSSLRAECGSPIVETAQLKYVFDGDTLKLDDGRHVRVLGINTPEINHGNDHAGQPLGEAARAAAIAFFKRNKTVKLGYDNSRVDHYGRSLADVYDMHGNNLAAYLLRLGLGFQVSVPPNTSSAKCLRGIEEVAKRQYLGVWGNSYWQPQQASELTLMDAGFKRVRGKVVKVHQAKSVWLELDGPLTIHIFPADEGDFIARDWQQWKGRQVEVRGWITKRKDDSKPRKDKSSRAFKSLAVNVLAEDVQLLK